MPARPTLIRCLSLAVCVATALAGCQQSAPPPNTPTVAVLKPTQDFNSASRAYALDVLRNLNTDAGNTNLAFSPMGIEFAMGMLHSAGDRQSAQAIADAWHLDSASAAQLDQRLAERIQTQKIQRSATTALHIANGLFLNRPARLNVGYQTRTQPYVTGSESLDFAAPGSVRKINGWVSRHTAGRIPSIVDKLDANSQLLLINAVSFTAQWQEDWFQQWATIDAVFHGTTGNTTVPTMQQAHVSNYYEDNNVQAVNLEYRDGNYSLFILLPKAKQPDTLDRLIEQLDAKYFTKVFNNARRPKTSYAVAVFLPRFHIEYFNDQLFEQSSRLLGVDLQQARFPSMLIGQSQKIATRMAHKASITVDEKGTAATASTVVAATAPPAEEARIFNMSINRPFVYAVMDRGGQIVFLGTVKNIPGRKAAR